MLTPNKITSTHKELQENLKRLGYPTEQICIETELTPKDLMATIQVADAKPSNVWKLRDYLDDKLTQEGISPYPWTALANHTANRWYPYDTPWRH